MHPFWTLSKRRRRSVVVVGFLAIASLSFVVTRGIENLSSQVLPSEPSSMGFLACRSTSLGGSRTGARPTARAAHKVSAATVTTDSNTGALAASWQNDVRTLLLSRNVERQRAALQRIQSMYEQKSGDIFSEFAFYGASIVKGSFRDRFHLRPLLGYQSACASVYRTVIEHVMPEQAGSSVQVRKRGADGTKGVRYALKDDVMDGSSEDNVRQEDADQESPESEYPPTSESDTAQKARALIVVLRQLPGSSPWSVEHAAARAKEEDEVTSSSDKWLKRTPDLETPDYQVMFQDPAGLYEIRKYAAYSVVQTKMADNGNGTKAFFSLAGYIFGKTNVEQQKMAMTTPVQSDPNKGTMSFIMPKQYWGEVGLQAAPAPMVNASVELIPRSEEVMAVSVFGGYARSRAVKEKSQALLNALEAAEGIEIVDRDALRLMQYNDPFTVPWKRRNEVAVAVRLT